MKLFLAYRNRCATGATFTHPMAPKGQEWKQETQGGLRPAYALMALIGFEGHAVLG